MKLECRHVWQHISGYLDKQLDPELLADVERHLETCEVCSAILDSTRNILVLTTAPTNCPLATANVCTNALAR